MNSAGKTTKMTTHSQVVNYMLSAYTTVEEINDTEDELTPFSQLPNKIQL